MKLMINLVILIGIICLFVYSDTIYEALLSVMAFMLWGLLALGNNDRNINEE